MAWILLCGWLIIRLVEDVRSKDTFKMVAGVVTLALAVLVRLGVIALPDGLR